MLQIVHRERSVIPLPASRRIGCSMGCTLYAVRTPHVQQVAASLAATRWTVLTPAGRMSYAKLQPSELANDTVPPATRLSLTIQTVLAAACCIAKWMGLCWWNDQSAYLFSMTALSILCRLGLAH
jgi:hypothetical protein